MKLTVLRSLPLMLLLPVATLLPGCAGSAGGITLTSMRTHQSYNQGFSDAYTCRNARGDLDIVLVDDAGKRLLTGNAASNEVRQVMHLRVLWQPDRDMKTDDLATSNASVHWYVVNGGGTLEYAGTAMVSTTTFSGLTRVAVHNAEVKPVCGCPGLRDPIGRAHMDGVVFAHPNARAVATILSEVQTSVAVAR